MATNHLKPIELLSNFSNNELSALYQLMLEEKYHAGSIIYSPFESSENLFIVKSGQVIVTHQLDGDVITLARLPKGYFFGESGILKNNSIHKAQARAESDEVVVYKLTKPNFEKLKKQNPKTALKLIEKISLILSNRLTDDTARIAAISAISDLITNPDTYENASSLAKKILIITKKIIPSRNAFLGVYPMHNKNELNIIASIGLSPKHLPKSLPIDSDTYLSQIIQKNKTIQIPSDRYKNSEKVFYAKKNILGCPIVAENENIGALVLSDKEEGEFTNNNSLILFIIASQISFALEEARIKLEKSEQEELKREYIKI